MAKIGFVVGNGRTRVPRESTIDAIDYADYLSIELIDAVTFEAVESDCFGV